jgi:hypothetical protein
MLCRVLALIVVSLQASSVGAQQVCGAGAPFTWRPTGGDRENVLLQMSPVLYRQAHLKTAETADILQAEKTAEKAEKADVALTAATADAVSEADVGLLQGDWYGCNRRHVSRRRRIGSCHCRRRSSSSVESEWACKGYHLQPLPAHHTDHVPAPSPARSVPASPRGDSGASATCLCVFDIDRTLTGRQFDTKHCPRNRQLDMWDEGYGGGRVTLSALGRDGIATTFCNQCLLGITSAGQGSGADSKWNHYILEELMRGERHDAFTVEHPHHKHWSHGTGVRSPYVLSQGNRHKQVSVELIRQWYGKQGVDVLARDVFFFGDRAENIMPFREKGLNSRQISCTTRAAHDRRQYAHSGSGMVGYCGATPEEIKPEIGNILCA